MIIYELIDGTNNIYIHFFAEKKSNLFPLC